MRKIAALVAVALLGSAVSGCDTMKALGLYREDPAAERAARLRVPPDLARTGLNESMSIPGSATYSEYSRGAGSKVLQGATDQMEVHKAGGQRWLEVAASPDQVWKWLHGYLKRYDLNIAKESAPLGVLQTDWILHPVAMPRGVFSPELKNAKDARVADYYVFRLEPGTKEGSTEVYVAQRRMAAEGTAADAVWSWRPADPFLESEMMRGFMVYLGAQRAESAQRVVAAEAAEAPVRLDSEDGQPRLVLRESFFNAWRQVGLAIDRLGFSLADRNRSQGQYFVRYDPKAETGPQEKGFFESLAFWRKEKAEAVDVYVINLRESAGRTQVSVTTEEGKPAARDVAERILALLAEQLR